MTAPNDDWLAVLAAACNDTSQNAVGKRLGVSGGTISQVLSGKYPASTHAIEERVRGVLMQKTVDCPQLGELSAKDCIDWQGRPFAATNPLRVRMYQACKRCPLRRA